ncbi:MAG: AAA family ATPase [Patescibacteria group bacterium]|nr:AAA family ATPase [Patescibacteria group bacterium]
MGKIISLVNQKGGVGKTTTAVNLSQYLAEKGRLVLLVDLDPQANATSGVGISNDQIKSGVYDVLIRNLSPMKAIIGTGSVSYDVIPSSVDLSGASIELANVSNREYRLYDALKTVRNDYDYIIIDSPPSLDLLTINGLVASDGVIIPVQCEYYSLEGLSRLLETISLIKKGLKSDLKVMGAVLTMYDKRNKLARQVVKEVQNNFPGKVFNSVVPRNVRLSEAPSFGKTILNFSKLSKGAKAYNNLAKEIMDMEENNFTI